MDANPQSLGKHARRILGDAAAGDVGRGLQYSRRVQFLNGSEIAAMQLQ